MKSCYTLCLLLSLAVAQRHPQYHVPAQQVYYVEQPSYRNSGSLNKASSNSASLSAYDRVRQDDSFANSDEWANRQAQAQAQERNDMLAQAMEFDNSQSNYDSAYADQHLRSQQSQSSSGTDNSRENIRSSGNAEAMSRAVESYLRENERLASMSNANNAQYADSNDYRQSNDNSNSNHNQYKQRSSQSSPVYMGGYHPSTQYHHGSGRHGSGYGAAGGAKAYGHANYNKFNGLHLMGNNENGQLVWNAANGQWEQRSKQSGNQRLAWDQNGRQQSLNEERGVEARDAEMNSRYQNSFNNVEERERQRNYHDQSQSSVDQGSRSGHTTASTSTSSGRSSNEQSSASGSSSEGSASASAAQQQSNARHQESKRSQDQSQQHSSSAHQQQKAAQGSGSTHSRAGHRRLAQGASKYQDQNYQPQPYQQEQYYQPQPYQQEQYYQPETYQQSYGKPVYNDYQPYQYAPPKQPQQAYYHPQQSVGRYYNAAPQYYHPKQQPVVYYVPVYGGSKGGKAGTDDGVKKASSDGGKKGGYEGDLRPKAKTVDHSKPMPNKRHEGGENDKADVKMNNGKRSRGVRGKK